MAISFRIGSLRRSLRTTAVVDAALRPGGGSGTLEERRRFVGGGLGHGQFGFDLVVFPAALADFDALDFVGFSLAWMRGFGSDVTADACTERADCTETGRISVPSDQTSMSAHLLIRHKVGRLAEGRGGTLMGRFGFDRYANQLGRDALDQVDPSQVIPSVDYRGFSWGMSGDVFVIPAWLRLDTHLTGSFAGGPGPAALAIWGLETRTSRGMEFGGGARLSFPEGPRGLTLGLHVDWQRWRTRFRGQTACRTTGCGVEGPTEAWPTDDGTRTGTVVGGLADPVMDRATRFALSVGYAIP